MLLPLLAFVVVAQWTSKAQILDFRRSTPSPTTTTTYPPPGPLTLDDCRQTQICLLMVQGIFQCNGSTINIRSQAENLAFQSCICRQTGPARFRPWNQTMMACLECFYDNYWLRYNTSRINSLNAFDRFCNDTTPNITNFDGIAMVELVAGIAAPSRGGFSTRDPNGPRLWRITTINGTKVSIPTTPAPRTTSLSTRTVVRSSLNTTMSPTTVTVLITTSISIPTTSSSPSTSTSGQSWADRVGPPSPLMTSYLTVVFLTGMLILWGALMV
ncbi:MAG: hypothetical protein M1823_001676 [Watsoniomyces obsoletus]|nr:MAG: hypothetical protein M1823_001676 [Watsoniomyces obsoletus]